MFAKVRADAQSLTELIALRSGRQLVAPVTVPEPEEPPSELYFVRLVSWGYVFFNEAGGGVFKELARLLKSGRPDLSRTYQEGRRDIDALRTTFAHNLPNDGGNNDRTKRIADAWLIQHGANDDWPSRCSALHLTLCTMLGTLRETFLQLCDGDGVERMLETIDRFWQPHLFDTLVEEIARDIGLPAFDTVAFRRPRQEQWAGLASLFAVRDDAAHALKRVIRAELERIFGSGNERL